MCRLNHVEFLEAAHILPGGRPFVSNGMAMCSTTRPSTATSSEIRPNLVVEIRQEVLPEIDRRRVQ
ncbi:MAG: hypothetical protein ACRD1K_09040 [Acidimicrobiales bacterium]